VQQSGPASLTMLVSGNPPDIDAMRTAADAWAQRTGNTVTLNTASDMAQQLGQGFASGNPPDVFMIDAQRFGTYAKNGDLLAYGDALPYKDDLYPALRQTFTYDGQFYCAPKDFSTLGLQINTDKWAAAGLTDADVPTTWEELRTVAQRLTTPEQTGLVFADTRDRMGAFMVQAGGGILNAEQTQVIATDPGNVQALEYVRTLLTDGSLKFPKQVGSGDAIEAFGQGKAAMIIEGNWFFGAISKDFPDVRYTVASLPVGPAGPGTLSFTPCWGIAARSEFQEQAKDLVNALMTEDQQLTFAEVFGVMPSRMSVREEYQQRLPQFTTFLESAEHARGPVTLPGAEPVLLQFDTGLQQLPAADPQQLLNELEANMTPLLQTS
jgi:multiple sugar transport system substrate-binding protein